MKRETLEKRFGALIEELQTEIKSSMEHEEAGRWGAVADTMESAATVCKRMAQTAKKLAGEGPS